MKQLELKMIRLLTAPNSYTDAEEFLKDNKATILEAKDERVKAEIDYAGSKYKVLIQKNEERNFDTSCNCNSDKRHPLCLHKTILLIQLLNKHGVGYFDSIRNWDKEKNKLLEAYGYSLTDDLKGKFEFAYKDGKPFLRVLDISIKRIAPPITGIYQKPLMMTTGAVEDTEEEIAQSAAMQLGIVFIENNLGPVY